MILIKDNGTFYLYITLHLQNTEFHLQCSVLSLKAARSQRLAAPVLLDMGQSGGLGFGKGPRLHLDALYYLLHGKLGSSKDESK